MSGERAALDLLDRLRQLFDAFAVGDFDAAMAIQSEHGVLDMSPVGMGVFEGHKALRGIFEDWFEPYEEYRVEPGELCDLGNNVTFSVLTYSGRPHGSSRFVDVCHAYASVWADGLIERTTGYADIDEGRAAAERLAAERG